MVYFASHRFLMLHEKYLCWIQIPTGTGEALQFTNGLASAAYMSSQSSALIRSAVSDTTQVRAQQRSNFMASVYPPALVNG